MCCYQPVPYVNLLHGFRRAFCLLESEGMPVGVIFPARKETRVFLIAIFGIYFDVSAEIEELLEEKLRALDRLPAP